MNFSEQCDEYFREGAVSKPDPDIGGIGVILAFVISAYITLAAVLVAYFGAMNDARAINFVDKKIFHARPIESQNTRIYRLIRKAVLTLGDQQIVTGIAILAAGFRGLVLETISVYHFQVVLYLAWMSSSVHLSALTISESFLNKHPGLMIWRLVCMCVLLALLLVGLVPTISNDWGVSNWQGITPHRSGWAIPAKCLWINRRTGDINPDAILGYIILIISYVWKIGGLFAVVRKFYRDRIRDPVEFAMISLLRHAARKSGVTYKTFWLCMFRLALSFTLPVFALLETMASFSASVWLSVLGLIFGTMQIFIPRGQNLFFAGAQENEWGFGQLVPLVLLAQMLGLVAEYIWPSLEHKEQQIGNASTIGNTSSSRDSCFNEDDQSFRMQLRQFSDAARSAPPGIRHEELQRIKFAMFESKMFSALIWLLQIAIGATAVQVFYFDAGTIGNTEAQNWQYIVPALAGLSIVSILLVLVVAPFSRLG